MTKQDPLRTLTDILEAPDSWVGEYEIEIDGEIILLDGDSISAIKKVLNKGILNKEIKEAGKAVLKNWS